MSGALVDELSVVEFCLEGGVGEDVAGGGLACLGEAKHGDGVLEEVEEGDIACLDRLEEALRSLLA